MKRQIGSNFQCLERGYGQTYMTVILRAKLASNKIELKKRLSQVIIFFV